MKRKPKKRVRKRRLSVNRRLLKDLRESAYDLTIAKQRESGFREHIAALRSLVANLEAKLAEFQNQCALATVRPEVAERFPRHTNHAGLSIVLEPVRAFQDFREESRHHFSMLDNYCAGVADEASRKLHTFLIDYFRQQLGITHPLPGRSGGA